MTVITPRQSQRNKQNTPNQSKLEAKTCNQKEAQEKACRKRTRLVLVLSQTDRKNNIFGTNLLAAGFFSKGHSDARAKTSV